MKLRRRQDDGGGAVRLPDFDDLRPWAPVVAAVVVAFAVGWIVAAQVLFPPTSEAEEGPVVEVPEVVEMTVEEARERLEEEGLSAEVSFRVTASGADSGRVRSQRPLAGQMARQGSTVQLTVNGSPGQVRVPGLQGLPRDRARSILEDLGLEVTTRQQPSALRTGEVVGTDPPAGSRVAASSTVELVVSEGPEVSRVPELVGRHVYDVPGVLRAADLALGAVEFDPDAAAAPGRVVGQSPPPDFALRRGGTVSIRVAGPRGDWTRPSPPDTSAASGEGGIEDPGEQTGPADDPGRPPGRTGEGGGEAP